MTQKVLITAALLYANGKLHLGHVAGAYLPSDCYARFQRLLGNEVAYISGSDEYGVAITLSAELAKRTPREHVDHFHEINKTLFEKLNFSFDNYSRTTWAGHAQTTQDFFQVLQEKNLIEERVVDQLYSEEENRFLADRYVLGTCPKCGYEEARGDECQKCASSYEATDLINPKSKLTGSKLTLKKTNHFYLLFDHFKKELKSWLEEKNWKENVVNFAMSYIEDLRPRAISRDSSWGIPIPGVEGKVFYVWFDAPIGYISATKEWAEKLKSPDKWKDFWFDSHTKFVQFLGKDNIPFHAVFFPAMLMGQKDLYNLPDELPANEFLMLEGRQFSKSEGWYVDLDEFLSKYSADQARYVLAANAPESSDAEFSWKDFQMRCNAELLGKFGNFIHRVLVFTKQNLKGEIPSCKKLESQDEEFLHEMDLLMDRVKDSYERFHLRKVSQLIMELASLGNAYFDKKKPWVLAKNPEAKDLLDTTLYCSIECIKRLALISSPILPDASQKIWQMLGASSKLSQQNWDEVSRQKLEEGTKIQEAKVLFRKIEDEEITKEVEKLGKNEQLLSSPVKTHISYDQFDKLDLRVGQVVQAEKVPKSKKLLKLTVDLGFEKRTIVSGIALSYMPEEMIGRKFIVVANLSPAKIMGIESQGMILAASRDKLLELPQIQHLPPGSIVS